MLGGFDRAAGEQGARRMRKGRIVGDAMRSLRIGKVRRSCGARSAGRPGRSARRAGGARIRASRRARRAPSIRRSARGRAGRPGSRAALRARRGRSRKWRYSSSSSVDARLDAGFEHHAGRGAHARSSAPRGPAAGRSSSIRLRRTRLSRIERRELVRAAGSRTFSATAAAGRAGCRAPSRGARRALRGRAPARRRARARASSRLLPLPVGPWITLKSNFAGSDFELCDDPAAVGLVAAFQRRRPPSRSRAGCAPWRRSACRRASSRPAGARPFGLSLNSVSTWRATFFASSAAPSLLRLELRHLLVERADLRALGVVEHRRRDRARDVVFGVFRRRAGIDQRSYDRCSTVIFELHGVKFYAHERTRNRFASPSSATAAAAAARSRPAVLSEILAATAIRGAAEGPAGRHRDRRRRGGLPAERLAGAGRHHRFLHARSSTTRTTSAASPRPTRSPTSTRWAASRSWRSRSSACRSTSCRSSVIRKILDGGESVCAAAGIPVAGGHSIDMLEPIYGLVALGLVHPDKVKRNSSGEGGRRPDPRQAAGRRHPFGGAEEGQAVATRATSRWSTGPPGSTRRARRSPTMTDVHALTDVTGFGLAGHLLEICRGSKLAAEVIFRRSAHHRRGPRLGEAGRRHRRLRPELERLRRRKSS